MTKTARLLAASTAIALFLGAAQPVDMAKRAEELKSLRWGMFICWSFSTFSGKEWTPGVTDVSFFRAAAVDTDQWARTAKDAGMGYILFLTKHHDGFCLWDTRTTDRKVTKAPARPGRPGRAQDKLRQARHQAGALFLRRGLDLARRGRRQGRGGRLQPRNEESPAEGAAHGVRPRRIHLVRPRRGHGGLSHKETAAWCKSFQPGCFIGFNHGDQEGADIRLGEMGRPGPLTDSAAAGPFLKDAPARATGWPSSPTPSCPNTRAGRTGSTPCRTRRALPPRREAL